MPTAQKWMEQGTALLLSAVDDLDPSTFSAGTALPGWTRAHVLAHVASNADAVDRLVRWARTGVEHLMYASLQQRADDIEQGAALRPVEVAARVRQSASRLHDSLASLSPAAWQAKVVTVQGRSVSALELPWMRAREVCVHTVDLQAGIGFEDLPPDFCAALTTEVVERRSSAGDGPALALRTSDGLHSWTVAGSGTPLACTGTTAALTAWMTGRGSDGVVAEGGGQLPELTRWL